MTQVIKRTKQPLARVRANTWEGSIPLICVALALHSTGLTVPLGQQYPGGQGVGVVMLGLGQQKFGMHGVGVLEHGGQKVPG